MLHYKSQVPPDNEEEEEELDRPKPVLFVWLFGIVVVLAFSILAYQLYQIQVVRYDYFVNAADTNRFRTQPISAPRGVIYDRNGQLLVFNEPSFKVSIVPADLPKERQDAILNQLSTLLDVPLGTTLEMDAPDPVGSLANTLSRSFVSATRKPGLVEMVNQGRDNDPYTPVLIKTNVPRMIAFDLQERIQEFPGVQVGIDPIRNYPAGALTAHLLGYVGHIPQELYDSYQTRGYLQTDQVGLTGLEYKYEDQLRGQAGEREVEVDANGIVVSTLAEKAPLPGNNLYLTLDLNLQRATEQALLKGMQKANAKQAVAIVMNVNNGEILAMVSEPSYDNNLFAQGISESDYQGLSQDPTHPLVDESISGVFPPGSTFKLVAATGSLQEGVMDDKMTVTDPGVMYLPNKYFPDNLKLAQPFYNWFRPGFGPLTLRGAIAESCDTCFYKIVGGFTDFPIPLGPTLEASYARMFGYGSQLGIDLPGEATGLIPDDQWKRATLNEQWVTGDTYNMAIGQGFVLATPLQVVNMTAVVANGGTVYRPHFARQIVDTTQALTSTLEPQVVRRMPVDSKYFQLVREGMRDAVTYGTAWKVNLADVPVAGKTGTAEFYGPRINGNLPSHAWFTCFAPYDNPQIAIVVFVYNGGEGSEVAAPIATDILRAYFHLPPNSPVASPVAQPPPPETSSGQGTGGSAGNAGGSGSSGGAGSTQGGSAATVHKFVGHLASVQDASDHEHPVFDGTVLDAQGHGLAGITLSIDSGDGNAVATTTTAGDGSFHFADVDFHKSSRWYVRLITPVDSSVIAVDIQPYKRYTLVFNGTGQ